MSIDAADDHMSTADGPVEQYDVALSFAGEQRWYVDKVAAALRAADVRVFYDAYMEGELWGKDLYQHLDYVYSEAARFCVVFVSAAYAKKLWTNHELKSAQARAFAQNAEYILPARFDRTKIPGIQPTMGYLDLRRRSPEQLAQIIVRKVNPPRSEQDESPAPPGHSAAPAGRRPRSVAAALVAVMTGAAASLQVAVNPFGISMLATLLIAIGILCVSCSGLALTAGRAHAIGVGPVAACLAAGLALGLGGYLPGARDARATAATHTEIADNRNGTPLYSDIRGTPAAGGNRIPFGAEVPVSCKIRNTTALSSVTYWYQILSGPWRGYAPSDTFANGDPVGGPGTTSVDTAVPDCS